jgi:phage gpG-like protein
LVLARAPRTQRRGRPAAQPGAAAVRAPSRRSGGWQELADSTKARKAAKGREDPSRILYDSGDLFKSLTEAENDNAIRVSEHDEMRFGTTLPYAEFHQLGHGVPQRRFLELTETDRHQTFVQQAQRFLVTGTP